MHNAFLAIALTLASKNFKVLEIKDLKNDKVVQTEKSDNIIPDITDTDFMAEEEGGNISQMLEGVEDIDTLEGGLIDLDVDNDFAEVPESETVAEKTPTKPVEPKEEVIKISHFHHAEKQTATQTVQEKVAKPETEVTKQTVTTVVPKEAETAKQIEITINKKEAEKTVAEKKVEEKEVIPAKVFEKKAEVVETKTSEPVIAEAKKVQEVQPKKVVEVKKPVETKKEVAKAKKEPEAKITKIAETKKEYKEDEEFKAYLTKEEILDLKLTEVEEPTIPLIRPKKKARYGFVNTDVPEELISNQRSFDNRHIPTIISDKDIQVMAKNAIKDDNLERTRAIVEDARNPDLLLDDYKTVLNYATMLKRHRIMNYLIYNGADINLETPIFSSVENGDIRGLRILLERNANVNVENNLQKTPLMVALEKRNEKMALLLLKYGASGDIANRNGESALDLARRFKMIKVEAELLKQR